MPAPLEIKVLSVDAATWAAVIAPFDCSSMSMKNNSVTANLRMRTDAQSASTEDLLGPGKEQGFAVPFYRHRFQAGSQVLWLQAESGTVPVILKFLV